MFTLAEVSAWLDLQDFLPSLPIRCVITDSSRAEGGELFVALKGKQVDGHSFLEEVARKGAIAALVSMDYHGPDHGLKLIHVPNVIEALQKMAKNRLASLNPRIIGVTGSVGKTTTKDFLATLLSARFTIGKSPGNANSQVGLPTALLNFAGDEEVLVLEMSMSEPGQIAKLVDIAPPEVAVITKIGYSHTQLFVNGIDGIAEEKAEIFSHPSTKWGIASFQAGKFPVVCANGFAKKLLVGDNLEADVSFIKESSSVVRIEMGKESSGPVALPFTASHLIDNFVLAAVAARLFGLSFREIAERAQHLKIYKNRFELVEKKGILFLNDSYNASPESMRAALDNLPAVQGKKIAVFGEMPELGQYWHSAHREIATYALPLVDYLLCYGAGCMPMVDVFSSAGKPVEFIQEFSDLKKRVYALAKIGDLVLLKGANFNKLWRILEEEVSR